ncbi:hypothetical protein [Rheinheimera metallidurans]|uniref:hypothetical protein n=1 Tax=Rheinheimera metallidurans TaxID=2925781 RepID=UPI0030018DBE
MKLTKFFLLLGSLLCFSATKTEAMPLPDCTETVCSDIFHNKKLAKATVVVWGQKGIITSYSFDLDSSAVQGRTFYSSGSVLTTSSDTNPTAPCAAGNCSSSSSTTYQTPTTIITVTVTYTYFNGELIDVGISRTVVPKPSDMER